MVTCSLALSAAYGFQQKPTQVEEKTFRQDRAWSDLIKQCAFGPRKPGTQAHINCRDYIEAEMKKSCDNVHFQPFTHTWTTTGKPIKMWNIIGEQNYKNAKVRVVVIAHWDTRPTADEERDTDKKAQPIPGANDGASGVAVLLELARVLKDRLPADVGIRYLMVDGEDLGPGEDEMYLGAIEYTKTMGSQPKANYGILLDMIGQKDLAVPKEINSIRYANGVLSALYEHAARIGLSPTFPSITGEDIDDDHLPMIKAGLPTIDLIEFSGYMPYWHKLSDTPDKCSAESLGKVGMLLQTWFQKKPTFKLGD